MACAKNEKLLSVGIVWFGSFGFLRVYARNCTDDSRCAGFSVSETDDTENP